MKNNFKLLVAGALTATLLIPCLSFTQSQEPKKTRHIRMVKVENGKKMEIDTVLTGNDVFVWNGDTINPEKRIKGFSPSEFDKRHPDPMDRNQKHRRSFILKGEALDDSMIIPSDSTEDIHIINNDGDTVGEKIMIHKRLRNGEEKDHFIYLDEAGNGHFPPVPGVPPVPHVKRFRGMHSSKMINLNDPNVISFKKKDISGGREKIEIIRKKSTEPEHEDFKIDIDEAVMVPEPPMPPMMNGDVGKRVYIDIQKQDDPAKSKSAAKKAQRKADKDNK